MGFDVMSRRVHVHSSTSSSPLLHTHQVLERDRLMSDAYFHKSLTPNRKHHKLLKDGSEVWSEDVEKIFVEGLKEYWESPWATYSRGRSRWRNQFLVEHLKKAGINRSKKQVASHIQVLRNMWRFHLVAGGEELFAENGLLASPDKRKSVERLPTTDPAPGEASISSSASSPEYPMDDFSATLSHTMFPNRHSPVTPSRNVDAPPESAMFSSVSGSALAALGTHSPSSSAHRTTGSSVKLEPLHMVAGLSSFPPLPPSPMSGYLGGVNTSSAYTSVRSSNRLQQLSLWAEGMSTVTFDVDQMSTAMAMPPPSPHDPPPSILFRIKISITSIEDIHSSPNLHGLHGAITLASRWTSSANCVTKLFSGAHCIGHEIACALPESALSRCKWLRQGEIQVLLQRLYLVSLTISSHHVPHLHSLPLHCNTLHSRRQDNSTDCRRRRHHCRFRIHTGTYCQSRQRSYRRAGRSHNRSPRPHTRPDAFPTAFSGQFLPGRGDISHSNGSADSVLAATASGRDRP
ncbi:hypothetical protein BC629DRAFT_1462995 [Irpex lacteus]|nr:hypothetical protein BC629DRAFT_1462995 [Irpex lacteus]